MNDDRDLQPLILRRAGFRCEYCRRPFASGETWHQDHVIPRRVGGGLGLGNIAVSCVRCNQNKGSEITAKDPLTLGEVELFHPRRDDWEEHFRPLNHYVVGKTKVGRATATLLFRQTKQAPHSAPLPAGVGVSLVSGAEAAYVRWLFGQRKAGEFVALLSELEADDLIAELVRVRHTDRRSQGAARMDARLAVERAAVLAEALTSRCLMEDLVFGEDLCAAAVDACSAPNSPGRPRLRYFLTKRILVWRQIAVCFAIVGREDVAYECLRVAARLAPSLSASPAMDSSRTESRTVQLALPARDWRTNAGMEARWQVVLAEAEAGRIVDLLRFVDDIVFRGTRMDAERLGLVETMEALIAKAGYGMDADFHYGVLLMRRLLLLQARFEPSSVAPSLDLHLKRWATWGCLHNLRCLSLGLGYLRESFGARVIDLVDAVKGIDELEAPSPGAVSEGLKKLVAAQVELGID